MNPEHFGNIIKQIRRLKGIKLVDVAEKALITKGYLSAIENGYCKNPTLRIINNICKALDIQLIDVMKTSENTKEIDDNGIKIGDTVMIKSLKVKATITGITRDSQESLYHAVYYINSESHNIYNIPEKNIISYDYYIMEETKKAFSTEKKAHAVQIHVLKSLISAFGLRQKTVKSQLKALYGKEKFDDLSQFEAEIAVENLEENQWLGPFEREEKR